MAKKILLVDDIAINRAVLKACVGSNYDTLQAENGEEALALLRREYKSLSAVLLDIDMPILDGYGVLQQMQESPLLSQIPAIVVTGSEDDSSRVKALALGASDFVVKPYNPDIIRHCLRNNIMLRETASIVNAVQKDKLTGIYNRAFFFEKADELIASHEPGAYILTCIDIDSFKLINDRYGTPEGDRILKHIGTTLQQIFDEEKGICGRISGDEFAGLFPNQPEVIERMTHTHFVKLTPADAHIGFHISVGRYVVKERNLSASALYDRASIAKRSVKGRYDKSIAYFDDSMLAELLKKQQIIGDMADAVSQRQLVVWLQPQYNHATGALIGAEALVRWQHPQKGLIPPGEFIPIFEQNGFVYEVDKYVWEETCRLLRKWLDAGETVLPVSVNISRCDILQPDLITVLNGLVAKYSLPTDLLRLEVTESAFDNSDGQIVKVVQALVDGGFTVEIDDFGSGYSSLNILKDVPAQILKLDMRFLASGQNSLRGGSILESVVRMAKWLGMEVIAEGVETVAQANFLKSIGCLYIQGYLYARPMPVAEYEALLAEALPQRRLFSLNTVSQLDSNTFWDSDSVDTLIFSSFVGGACIFEAYNGKLELIRASDKFFKDLGNGTLTMDVVRKLDWMSYLDESSAAKLRENLAVHVNAKEEFTQDFCLLHLPGCPQKTYLHATLRVIASLEDRALIYCSSENTTKLWEVERQKNIYAKQISTIMANIISGVALSEMRDGKLHILYANDRFYDIFGYSPGEYAIVAGDGFGHVHSQDVPLVAAALTDSLQVGESRTLTYRASKKDGAEIWLRQRISKADFADAVGTVYISVLYDITEEKRSEQQLKLLTDSIPGGLATFEIQNGTVRFLYMNDGFYRSSGYTREEYEQMVAHDPFGWILEDDRPCAIAAVQQLLHGAEKSVMGSYRCRNKDGGFHWFSLTGIISEKQGETYTVSAIKYDINDLMTAEKSASNVNK